MTTAFNAMAATLLRSREDLKVHALHDPLTGLPNRILFMERMEHAIERADRRSTPVSVLYIDVDDFKTVNDTLGHAGGDETLIAVSGTLAGLLRSEDTVARIGGDEFVVLLEEDLDGATRTADRISHTFGDIWQGRQDTSGGMPIGLSVGIATRRGIEGCDDVIRRADAAMYMAKAAGKGSWRVSTDEDAGPSLGSELHRAVANEEFVVHYQPLVALRTGAIEAVEALVRWNHPERGLLAPDAFLDEAERSGQIVQIDRWVLQEACRQVRTWQEHVPGAADLSVHVEPLGTAAATTGMGRQRHADVALIRPGSRACRHRDRPRPRWWPTPRRPRRNSAA